MTISPITNHYLLSVGDTPALVTSLVRMLMPFTPLIVASTGSTGMATSRSLLVVRLKVKCPGPPAADRIDIGVAESRLRYDSIRGRVPITSGSSCQEASRTGIRTQAQEEAKRDISGRMWRGERRKWRAGMMLSAHRYVIVPKGLGRNRNLGSLSFLASQGGSLYSVLGCLETVVYVRCSRGSKMPAVKPGASLLQQPHCGKEGGVCLLMRHDLAGTERHPPGTLRRMPGLPLLPLW